MGMLIYVFYKINFLWTNGTHTPSLEFSSIVNGLESYILLPSYSLPFATLLTSQIAHVLFLYLTLTLVFGFLYVLFSQYNFVFT